MDDPSQSLLDVGVRQNSQSKRSTLRTVCPYILANEFCERLAAVGLSVNLVTYLVNGFQLSPSDAAIQVSMWLGFCYTTPLLGAYLADSVLGRYRTIMLFSMVYLLGLLLLVGSAVTQASGLFDQTCSQCRSYLLYTALYTVALGTGGIKPCVAAFGADQFDENCPLDVRDKESFFNWFYFSINLGSLLGSIVVVYVTDHVSFAWGLAIPASAMFLAVLSFIAGSRLYRHVAPSGSPILRVFKVVYRALRIRVSSKVSKAGAAAWKPDADGGNAPAQVDVIAISGDAPPIGAHWLDPAVAPPPVAVHRTKSLKWLDCAATDENEPLLVHTSPSTSPLAGKGFSVQQVEEVKLVLRLLPVFLTTLGYWAIFTQIETTFLMQGQLMDTRVALPNGWSLRIPSAAMFSIDTLAVLLVIPAYDAVIEPALRRLLGRKITLLQKIGCGLVIAILAMLAAAAVENTRLWRVHHGPQGANNLSILWQIPQFAIVGASEVFASVGQLEFFYGQAPDVMRSFALALQLSSIAMGGYLSGLLVMAAHSFSYLLGQDWMPQDLNNGRMDLYYLFMAGALGLNTLLFLWVASNYEYKAVHPPAATAAPEAYAPPLLPPETPVSGLCTIPGSLHTPSGSASAGGDLQHARSLARMPSSPPQLAPLR